MKRKLIKQMNKEWRSNFWLVLELIIVGTAMAAIMSLLFYILDKRFQSPGYEVKDAYVIGLSRVTNDSPDFIERTKKEYDDDIYTLMERIKALPEVELLGYGDNAMPFNYNYWGNNIKSILDDDTIQFNGNCRYVSSQYPLILNLKGVNGETPEQLSKMLENGEILVTEVINSDDKPIDAVGREFGMGKRSVLYRLGAVLPGMKRADFEAPGPAIIIPYEKSGGKLRNANDFFVKIKHGSDKSFKKAIEDNPERWSEGNIYVSEITSVDNIRAVTNRSYNQTVSGIIICCGFLLISIFLGLLGTFWFRTGQRTVEIAVRLVNGATRRQIFARLMTEGLIIWACSLVVILAFMVMVFNLDLLSEVIYSDMKTSIIYGTIIAVGSLLIMVFCGILFPALRAMKIQPAIALKDE